MPSDRKPSLTRRFAVVALLLLLGYVATYVVAVEPVPEPIRRVYHAPAGSEVIVAYYDLPVSHESATWFFAPLHWLDRYLVRPSSWDREFPWYPPPKKTE